MAYPRAKDFIGQNLAPLDKTARRMHLDALKRVFNSIDRHTESSFVVYWCITHNRVVKGVGPGPDDIEGAGRLLARGVEYGWLIDAPGPHGGAGWKINPFAKA